MGNRVLLGLIITKILGPGPPVDKELALTGPVLDPIKTHVEGLGAFMFDVYLLGGGRLGTTLFFERCTDGNGFRAIDVGCSNFGFGGRPHYIAHDSGNGEKGPFRGRVLMGGSLGEAEILLRK
jgi:hypothetical protein